MKTLLWIGDYGCDTGFERGTRYTLRTLSKHFNVVVLGLNYRGFPGPKSDPYPYRAYPCPPGDPLGLYMLSLPELAAERPDVIVIQNDPWNFPKYAEVLQASNVPVVGIVAVDGTNCRGGKVNVPLPEGASKPNLSLKYFQERGLNELSLAIFWTEFGRREAVEGGYEGPSAVVPLGVDRSIYHPYDKASARKTLGLPVGPDDFLIGCVGRNQYRKRLDLMIMYFAEWIARTDRKNAKLFIHSAPTGDAAFDLDQLTGYCRRRFNVELQGQVLLSTPEVYRGLDEGSMAMLYSAMDVLASTSQNEGFNLPAIEAMACGTTCLLPDWAAHSDWAKDATFLVPCTSWPCTPGSVNAIGGVPDREFYIHALEALYVSPLLRQRYEKLGLDKAREKRYDWNVIGNAINDAIQQTLWPAAEEATA